MELRVGILGIGGSERRLLIGALADLIAAELRVRVAVVGVDVWCKTPEEDVLLPGFAPDGVFISSRLSRLYQRGAIASVRWPRLSALLTLAHWAAQERLIQRISATYRPDIVFSDGSLLLSLIRRTLSSLDPQTTFDDYAATGAALLAYIVRGTALPAHIARSIPNLKVIRDLRNLNQRLRLRLLEPPDALVFLETTLGTVSGDRPPLSKGVQTHDITQLQTVQQTIVSLLRQWRGEYNVIGIDSTGRSTEHMLGQMIDFIRTLLRSQPMSSHVQERLGTTNQDLSQGSAVAKKIFTYPYLRYMLLNSHRGSLHEIMFPLSPFGRFFLREGYSAAVMQAIYVQGTQRHGPLDRAFFNYPLHRAIFYRQHLLRGELECEIRLRLILGQPIRILCAPSGYAVELLQALKRLTRAAQEKPAQIHILASDLDPDGEIEAELRQTVPAIGCDLTFLRGDITSSEVQAQFERFGPYDIVIFVGLSSWVSKPDLLQYLTLVRTRLLSSGEQSAIFFTDCFTPHAFALSGKYFGYQASYYSPREFSHLLVYCGFSGASTALTWNSDPTGITHLCIARLSG